MDEFEFETAIEARKVANPRLFTLRFVIYVDRHSPGLPFGPAPATRNHSRARFSALFQLNPSNDVSRGDDRIDVSYD